MSNGWIMIVILIMRKAIQIVVNNINISVWFWSIILLEIRLPRNIPLEYILIIQAEISGFKPI